MASYGYEGAITPNRPWAVAQRALGSRYMVADIDACEVVPLIGGTRQVQVNLGTIGGQGILDEFAAPTTVDLVPVSTTVTEYFVIHAHREWGVTQATSFIATTAGTSQPSTLPARTNNPGTADDQPLALVRMPANETLPEIVWDLRCIGGPNEYHMHPDLPEPFLAYLDQVGVVVHQGRTTRRRVVDFAAGTESWQVSPLILSGDQVAPHIPGNDFTSSTGGPVPTALVYENGQVRLKLEARKQTVGTFELDSRGGLGDPLVTVLTEPIRPRVTETVQGFYRSAGFSATYGCTLTIDPAGQVRLISGAPNTSISNEPSGVTLTATKTYSI